MADDETCDLLCLDLPHADAVRTALPAAPTLEGAAATAKALGDPTRMRIALALATGGPMCGCDLAWVTGLAANLVSHHARVLRSCGLASSRRDGKLVVYRLTALGRELLGVLGVHGATDGAPTQQPVQGRPAGPVDLAGPVVA
ncbi:metalloregulator ArsR/SmtB family transcription factor [Pseudokineococcus basanitobsidens]|uniref:Metalloregulator ArsR/SmtB family transcription factor n=1 Tax=Pseudokineococcus basanitobsidens TaxID=1926649 RepID=A0ABU8RKY1_9ACTN